MKHEDALFRGVR